jgi:hypothetical protein
MISRIWLKISTSGISSIGSVYWVSHQLIFGEINKINYLQANKYFTSVNASWKKVITILTLNIFIFFLLFYIICNFYKYLKSAMINKKMRPSVG